MSWKFIDCVLNEVGIPKHLNDLIMLDVTSVHLRVLWKGNSVDFFEAKKGLRQGDMLPPYLFVICMDKLSHMIHDAVENKQWHCLNIGKDSLKVSHLMFVDDLILFGTATDNQINVIMDILSLFCNAYAHHINMVKSNIMFSRNTLIATRKSIIAKSGFRETASLGTYLRVPLSGKSPKFKDFHYLIEKVQAKLAH